MPRRSKWGPTGEVNSSKIRTKTSRPDRPRRNIRLLKLRNSDRLSEDKAASRGKKNKGTMIDYVSNLVYLNVIQTE